MNRKTPNNKARLVQGLGIMALAGAALTSALLLTPAPASAAPRGNVASLTSCGESGVKLVGFSDALNKTSFGGFSVAELSGLTYDDRRDVFYAVADRAGTVSTHYFTLDIPLSGASLGTPTVQEVTVLNNAAGVPFNGLSFDGEGIALTKRGDIAVASEGGSAAGEQPEIRLFEPDGTHKAELAVPTRFQIGTNNVSFESLGISPSGRSLFTATEAALAVDGQTADLRSRIRVLRYERFGHDEFAPDGQFHYETQPGRTPTELGVAEVIALSDRELLVLERGFVAGAGNTIRIFRSSIKHSPDVTDIPSLAATGFSPMDKRLLVDLVDCPAGAATIPPGATQPNALLDNFEAMTLGPKLGQGYRSLILMSDDNSAANQTTRVVVLAVHESLLRGSDSD